MCCRFRFSNKSAFVVTRILMAVPISFSLEIWLAAARELLEIAGLERSRPSSWGCSGEARAFYFRRLEDLFVLFGDNVTTLPLRQM
jgi:hypothetical protein